MDTRSSYYARTRAQQRYTVQHRRQRERRMVAFGLALATIAGFAFVGLALWPH